MKNFLTRLEVGDGKRPYQRKKTSKGKNGDKLGKEEQKICYFLFFN